MKTIIININEVTEDTSIWLEGTSVMELNDVLWDALAPVEGKAPTAAGEILRKCNSTIRRYLNNGYAPAAWRCDGIERMSDFEVAQFLFDYLAFNLGRVCATKEGKQVLADAGIKVVFED